MVKLSKAQRFREKMRTAAKQPKQRTLDNISETEKKEASRSTTPEQEKQIVITEIGTITKEDDLEIRVSFRLLPSKKSFSKITSDLFFDDHKLDTRHLKVLQGQLALNDSEFAYNLGMKGIGAGSHIIKVEMYELWNSEEKLTSASKEITTNYVPIRREDRLIEIPIVKHVAGADLQIISDSEKDIYRELEESMKKDQISKRDEW